MPLMADEDTADIRAALDGDGEAYARIVRRYQAEIGRMAWRFTRRRQDYEELVQQVFVEAYSSLRSYKGKAPLLHWLRRIATRVGYRHWKELSRRRSQPLVPLQDWDEDSVAATDSLSSQEAAETVHALLGRLPPRDRLVLTLIYLEERSVAETAELTGWTKAMVKVQAFRARAKLKKLLLEVWEGEPT
jgi:RNA polymerase sigma-70 factor (ECF subfamily)